MVWALTYQVIRIERLEFLQKPDYFLWLQTLRVVSIDEIVFDDAIRTHDVGGGYRQQEGVVTVIRGNIQTGAEINGA